MVHPGASARKSMLRAVILAGAALSLAACLPSLTAEPPESLLTLEPMVSAPSGQSLQTGSESGAPTIAVYTPSTPAKLNVLRIPVAVNEFEIAYLQDAVWVEKPARLFRRLLGETLRANGSAMVLDGDENPVVATHRLRGTLLDMGYDAQSASVVVRYDAMRTGSDGVTETRRFEASESVIEPETASIAPALNRAANKVAGDVAAWVNAASVRPSAPAVMDDPAN